MKIATHHHQQQIMEILKLFITIFVIFCSQKVAASVTTVSLKKTAGQLLDEMFSLLRRDFQLLQKKDNDLKMKINKLTDEIKTLKLIHGKCAPCQSIKTTVKYCDCTNHQPMKDCLEFRKAGFKVRTTKKLTIIHHISTMTINYISLKIIHFVF